MARLHVARCARGLAVVQTPRARGRPRGASGSVRRDCQYESQSPGASTRTRDADTGVCRAGLSRETGAVQASRPPAEANTYSGARDGTRVSRPDVWAPVPSRARLPKIPPPLSPPPPSWLPALPRGLADKPRSRTVQHAALLRPQRASVSLPVPERSSPLHLIPRAALPSVAANARTIPYSPKSNSTQHPPGDITIVAQFRTAIPFQTTIPIPSPVAAKNRHAHLHVLSQRAASSPPTAIAQQFITRSMPPSSKTPRLRTHDPCAGADAITDPETT